MLKTNQINHSVSFTRSSIRVIFAILLFVLVYLTLITFSIALLTACIYAGVLIIIGLGNLFTSLLGLGIIGIGVMFFLFLLKFIFTTHKDINPYRKRIFAKDHPAFFDALKEVSKQTGTRIPRKVYISNTVSASVFFNSSFLSLFLPVRKNLVIGLGLINSLNITELKSIVAHEFAHFSQRSMHLGSYVYIVNKVIYNLAYSYGKIDQVLEGLSNSRNIFCYFAKITYFLINQVRSILKKTYNVVNIPYLKLSREMEYHADTVAAGMYGVNNYISALRRLEFSDMAFNQTLEHLHKLFTEGKVSVNIYKNHSFEIKELSSFFKIKISNHLPIISDSDLDKNTVNQRIQFEHQWSTHPSRQDREKYIKHYSTYNIPENNELAWVLFNDINKLQVEISSQMYIVNFGNLSDQIMINEQEYIANTTKQKNTHTISEIFKDFYDNRIIHVPESKVIEEGNITTGELDEMINTIYSQVFKNDLEQLEANNSALHTLRDIKNKVIKTTYFQFDNINYKRKDVSKIINILNTETEVLLNKIKERDIQSFIFNYQVSKNINAEAMQHYLHLTNKLREIQLKLDSHISYIDKLTTYHEAIYSENKWSDEESNQLISDLSKLEANYKRFLKNQNFKNLENITEPLKTYSNDNQYYNSSVIFDNDKFSEFLYLVNEMQNILSENYTLNIKEITNLQNENLEKYKLMLTTT